MDIDSKEIVITCSDGFQLAGKIYIPQKVKGSIMIAPATGIRMRFYNSFATHLAEKGYAVICFENRGIGNSINGSINNGNPSLINWGRLDMTAVLKELQSRFSQTDNHLIGHSAGGQLVGLMENALDIKSMFNFASSSGQISLMNPSFKFKAHFYLNFFIPINNLIFGKTNSQWVGMGEPLPKKVAAQWSRWCNGAGYVATDFGKAVKHHLYDDLTLPSKWVHATDDDIANLANVKDMARVFSKSEKQILSLDPKELGYSSIGHMRFFSSKCKDQWNLATDWLKQFD